MTARWLFRVALLINLAAAAANADEPPARVFHIGIVAGLPRSSPEHAAFEERLRELGYVEGRNLTIDFVRDNDLDRLAAAVGEFARRGVDVIVTGGQDILKAAITATAGRATPMVFRAVDFDLLAKGYIASLSHPGGNLTGVVFEQPELNAKRLDLLTQTAPHITRIILLYDVASLDQRDAVTSAASGLGIPLQAIDRHRFSYELWAGHLGHVPDLGRLCRQDPEGRQTGRPSRPAAGEVRAGCQPEDRQGARPHRPAINPRPRRRGHRVNRRRVIRTGFAAL